MEQSTRFIGMDVHKDTIVVAVTATGEAGKATAYGTFPNSAAALEKLVRRFRQAGDGPLKFSTRCGSPTRPARWNLNGSVEDAESQRRCGDSVTL